MTDLKVLLFDIETSMAQVYAYGLWDQNISIENIIEHPRMIAFSAKWYGKKGTKFFSEYHHSRTEMLNEMHALLDEADVVAGYNSKSFDVKWIQGEFAVEGMTPPSPFKQLDMLHEVKRNFRFISNKLDYVSGRLLRDGKHEYNMARMWRIVNNPDTDEAVRQREWNAMKRYAIKDTNLLDPLVTALRPWLKLPHPVKTGDNLCRNCGSSDLQSRGSALTLNGTYPRHRCNTCGTWGRGTVRSSATNTRSIA